VTTRIITGFLFRAVPCNIIPFNCFSSRLKSLSLHHLFSSGCPYLKASRYALKVCFRAFFHKAMVPDPRFITRRDSPRTPPSLYFFVFLLYFNYTPPLELFTVQRFRLTQLKIFSSLDGRVCPLPTSGCYVLTQPFDCEFQSVFVKALLSFCQIMMNLPPYSLCFCPASRLSSFSAQLFSPSTNLPPIEYILVVDLTRLYPSLSILISHFFMVEFT